MVVEFAHTRPHTQFICNKWRDSHYESSYNQHIWSFIRMTSAYIQHRRRILVRTCIQTGRTRWTSSRPLSDDNDHIKLLNSFMSHQLHIHASSSKHTCITHVSICVYDTYRSAHKHTRHMACIFTVITACNSNFTRRMITRTAISAILIPSDDQIRNFCISTRTHFLRHQ